MHLLIPWAAPLADAGRETLAALELPRLRSLLGRLVEVHRDDGDEWTLSPPHERALARCLGWHGAAGALPWAARNASADGIEVGDLPWGQLTPVHWHVGTDQVSLVDPAELMLDEAASRRFFDAVLPLFTGEGYALKWGAPLRWYAAHESFAAMPCASLDRVIGRNVDPWLGGDPAARRIRRLQSEVQMVMYTHALNDERESRGLPVINSFWLHGCGVAQPAAGEAPRIDDRLRGPALAGDWAAWARGWKGIDAGPLAELAALVERGAAGAEVRLTLAGERGSIELSNVASAGAGGFVRRLRTRLQPPRPADILETL